MKSKLIKFYENSGYSKWPDSLFIQDRVKKMLFEIMLVLSENNKKKILDIGCGSGRFIYSIQKKFKINQYFGCDIANNIIILNKKNKKEVDWSVQDFNSKTNYKSDFFDLVIAGEVIEHVYDTDNFLYEINRITKKSGILIISTPNLASWVDRLFLFFGLQPHATEVSNVSRKFGREIFYKLTNFKEESNSVGHLRCFTKPALKSMLKHYGFEVIKNVPCHYHSLKINQLITKFLPGLSQGTLFVCIKTRTIFK